MENVISDRRSHGFTLIELSIVLVIIGLLSGGILGAKYMIANSKVRAQIAQFDRLSAAVNTFQAKYAGLPGDLTPRQAAGFGFVARTGVQGDGDGNNIVTTENPYNLEPINSYVFGELMTFWSDLSSAQLIEGTFRHASDGTNNVNVVNIDDLRGFLPQSKINPGTFLRVTSKDTTNSFTISALMTSSGQYANNAAVHPDNGLTPMQAYGIDSKIDDGKPMTGTVVSYWTVTVSGATSFYTDYAATVGAGAINACVVTPDALHQELGIYNTQQSPNAMICHTRVNMK